MSDANSLCQCGHVKVMHPLGVCSANIMGTDPDCECKEFRPVCKCGHDQSGHADSQFECWESCCVCTWFRPAVPVQAEDTKEPK